MIGRAFTKRRLLVFEEGSPELTNENPVSIADNRGRHPMQSKNFLNKNFCNLEGRIKVFDRNKMTVFRKTIHDYQNSIPSIVCRKSFHEVHGDIGPHLVRHWEWLQGSRWLNGFIVSSLTHITHCYKLFYILFKA